MNWALLRYGAENSMGSMLKGTPPDERKAMEAFTLAGAGMGRTFVLGTAEFDDLVRGHISFDNANIEDFVILRSDGQPTYHLSVVSDDIEMRITHVVRGDDHISNTPKQIILYHALGAPVPQFCHVPLILGPDKKRLSKRHGATSVMEYAKQGYLPDAMVNFLALLGWSPGNDQELFTRDELVQAFSLEGIASNGAAPDVQLRDAIGAMAAFVQAERHFPAIMLREVAEEVRIDTDYQEYCLGLINDDSNAVGAVHLGLAYLVEAMAEPSVADLALVDPRMETLEELRAKADKYETWSRLVFETGEALA